MQCPWTYSTCQRIAKKLVSCAKTIKCYQLYKVVKSWLQKHLKNRVLVKSTHTLISLHNTYTVVHFLSSTSSDQSQAFCIQLMFGLVGIELSVIVTAASLSSSHVHKPAIGQKYHCLIIEHFFNQSMITKQNITRKRMQKKSLTISLSKSTQSPWQSCLVV